MSKAQEIKDKGLEATKNKKNIYEKHFSNKPMMSPKSFSNAFPFHIIFDKNMHIKQCGTSIARLIPQIKNNKTCKLTDIFSIVRPHINLEYQQIYSQIMSVFVLCTKNGILALNSSQSSPKSDTSNSEDIGTRFKGQMVYLSEHDLILFQCSPSVMSLDDLFK